MAIKYLNVTVAAKKATYLTRQGDIVCGNSDYKIRFTFDSEWEDHDAKVARFIFSGHFVDVEFTGTEVAVPVIHHATEVKVGVYTEGDGPHTTTSATIPATPSVLCESATPAPETGGGGSGGGASVEVVQETGSSTTAVMSQAATTEALAGKLNTMSYTSTTNKVPTIQQNTGKQNWADLTSDSAPAWSVCQRNASGATAVGNPQLENHATPKSYVDAVYRHDITLAGWLDYGDTFGCISASIYTRNSEPWSYDGYGCTLTGSHAASGFISIDGQRYWVVGIAKAKAMGVASYIIYYANRDTGAVEQYIFIDGADFYFNDAVTQMT